MEVTYESTLTRRLLLDRSIRLALRSFFFGPRSSDKSGVDWDMTREEDRRRDIGSESRLELFDRLLSSSGIVEKSLGDVGERDLSGEKLVRLFVRSLISAESIGFLALLMQGAELIVTFFSGLRRWDGVCSRLLVLRMCFLFGEGNSCLFTASSSSSGQVSRVIRRSPICEGETGHKPFSSTSSSSGMSPLKMAASASSDITGVFLLLDLITFMRSETGDFCLTRRSLGT